MLKDKKEISKKQKVYRDIILGTLLYTVVLGFFNDYTKIIHTHSYSVTFSVALVMEILTFLTFLLKDRVSSWFKSKEAKSYRYLMILSIWLILFVSKFVFLEVIAVLFRSEVQISGFVGLLLMILCLTLIQTLIQYIDSKLATS